MPGLPPELPESTNRSKPDHNHNATNVPSGSYEITSELQQRLLEGAEPLPDTTYQLDYKENPGILIARLPLKTKRDLRRLKALLANPNLNKTSISPLDTITVDDGSSAMHYLWVSGGKQDIEMLTAMLDKSNKIKFREVKAHLSKTISQEATGLEIPIEGEEIDLEEPDMSRVKKITLPQRVRNIKRKPGLSLGKPLDELADHQEVAVIDIDSSQISTELLDLISQRIKLLDAKTEIFTSQDSSCLQFIIARPRASIIHASSYAKSLEEELNGAGLTVGMLVTPATVLVEKDGTIKLSGPLNEAQRKSEFEQIRKDQAGSTAKINHELLDQSIRALKSGRAEPLPSITTSNDTGKYRKINEVVYHLDRTDIYTTVGPDLPILINEFKEAVRNGARVIKIIGPGGTGKSHLVVHGLSELEDETSITHIHLKLSSDNEINKPYHSFIAMMYGMYAAFKKILSSDELDNIRGNNDQAFKTIEELCKLSPDKVQKTIEARRLNIPDTVNTVEGEIEYCLQDVISAIKSLLISYITIYQSKHGKDAKCILVIDNCEDTDATSNKILHKFIRNIIDNPKYSSVVFATPTRPGLEQKSSLERMAEWDETVTITTPDQIAFHELTLGELTTITREHVRESTGQDANGIYAKCQSDLIDLANNVARGNPRDYILYLASAAKHGALFIDRNGSIRIQRDFVVQAKTDMLSAVNEGASSQLSPTQEVLAARQVHLDSLIEYAGESFTYKHCALMLVIYAHGGNLDEKLLTNTYKLFVGDPKETTNSAYQLALEAEGLQMLSELEGMKFVSRSNNTYSINFNSPSPRMRKIMEKDKFIYPRLGNAMLKADKEALRYNVSEPQEPMPTLNDAGRLLAVQMLAQLNSSDTKFWESFYKENISVFQLRKLAKTSEKQIKELAAVEPMLEIPVIEERIETLLDKEKTVIPEAPHLDAIIIEVFTTVIDLYSKLENIDKAAEYAKMLRTILKNHEIDEESGVGQDLESYYKTLFDHYYVGYQYRDGTEIQAVFIEMVNAGIKVNLDTLTKLAYRVGNKNFSQEITTLSPITVTDGIRDIAIEVNGTESGYKFIKRIGEIRKYNDKSTIDTILSKKASIENEAAALRTWTRAIYEEAKHNMHFEKVIKKPTDTRKISEASEAAKLLLGARASGNVRSPEQIKEIELKLTLLPGTDRDYSTIISGQGICVKRHGMHVTDPNNQLGGDCTFYYTDAKARKALEEKDIRVKTYPTLRRHIVLELEPEKDDIPLLLSAEYAAQKLNDLIATGQLYLLPSDRIGIQEVSAKLSAIKITNNKDISRNEYFKQISKLEETITEAYTDGRYSQAMRACDEAGTLIVNILIDICPEKKAGIQNAEIVLSLIEKANRIYRQSMEAMDRQRNKYKSDSEIFKDTETYAGTLVPNMVRNLGMLLNGWLEQVKPLNFEWDAMESHNVKTLAGALLSSVQLIAEGTEMVDKNINPIKTEDPIEMGAAALDIVPAGFALELVQNIMQLGAKYRATFTTDITTAFVKEANRIRETDIGHQTAGGDSILLTRAKEFLAALVGRVGTKDKEVLAITKRAIQMLATKGYANRSGEILENAEALEEAFLETVRNRDDNELSIQLMKIGEIEDDIDDASAIGLGKNKKQTKRKRPEDIKLDLRAFDEELKEGVIDRYGKAFWKKFAIKSIIPGVTTVLSRNIGIRKKQLEYLIDKWYIKPSIKGSPTIRHWALYSRHIQYLKAKFSGSDLRDKLEKANEVFKQFEKDRIKARNDGHIINITVPLSGLASKLDKITGLDSSKLGRFTIKEMYTLPSRQEIHNAILEEERKAIEQDEKT